ETALVVHTEEALFAPSATDTGAHDYLRPPLELRFASRSPFNDTRDVGAGNMRERNLHVGEPVSGPEVEVIERAGPDPHQSFAVLGDGVGGVLLVPKNLGSSVTVEPNSFHSLSSRLGWPPLE